MNAARGLFRASLLGCLLWLAILAPLLLAGCAFDDADLMVPPVDRAAIPDRYRAPPGWPQTPPRCWRDLSAYDWIPVETVNQWELERRAREHGLRTPPGGRMGGLLEAPHGLPVRISISDKATGHFRDYVLHFERCRATFLFFDPTRDDGRTWRPGNMRWDGDTFPQGNIRRQP